MKSLVCTLNDNGGTETGILRIADPSYTLNVMVPIGTKFHFPDTVLVTDHDSMCEINPSQEYSVMKDIVFSIELCKPGSFYFRLMTSIEEGPKVRFIVDPIIMINENPVPPSGLIIQTNFGRCIGYIDDWIEKLKPISRLGYNMIHIPPFQELGHYSHYSIKDQLAISKFLFRNSIPEEKKWEMLRSTLKTIEKSLGIVFMTDIVLNHTSHDSEWLVEHPESGYHEENSPHLIPAIYIDNLLNEISEEIAMGKVPSLPPDLPSQKRDDLLAYITKRVSKSDFKRFFIIDEEAAIRDLLNHESVHLPKEIEMLRMRAVNYGAPQRLNILRTKGVINDNSYKMDSIRIDSNYSIALFMAPDRFDSSKLDEFKLAVCTINAPLMQHYESVVKDVCESVVNTFCYHRYDPNGPKLGPITLKTPIVWSYFSKVVTNKGLENEKVFHLANNGWIFGKKPTEDFISKDSEAYLRRQVVIWGDSVKLRFGTKPSDNPWLWEYMKMYVESVASVVHGLRLDNAHSTPLPVAEYFIKCARNVNPSMYIMAELFTGGEDEDMHYINTIGINSVVREAFHNLEPGALTHVLWLSGGVPVAAIDSLNSESIIRPLRQIPGVIFDLTHDNPVPHFDRLSVAAAVSMSASPVASTRGYDDYLQFNPSVVDEFRFYPLSERDPAIHSVRRIINQLHVQMAQDGYNELMAMYHGNLLSLFRCNSQSGNGVWMIVRMTNGDWVNELECASPIEDLVFEAHCDDVIYTDSSKDITPCKCNIRLNTSLKNMFSCEIRNQTQLVLTKFPVGSVVCFRTKLPQHLLNILGTLEVKSVADGFIKWTQQLSFTDLSVLMFRCATEERSTIGHGPYTFPGYGECFYAGTQGIVTAIESRHDMGNPVFQNIRDGDWLIDYMCKRLYQVPRLIPIEGYLRSVTDKIRALPRFLIPKFFDRVIRALDISGREQIKRNMSKFVREGDDFVHALAFSSVAFYGPVRDAPLVSEALQPIYKGIQIERFGCSLAAGLPHFASGYMRSWGRDTFIALRGIFMTTGRFSEAKDHLIAFASCLRHGLIPNLHDSCNNPRFNARDATWWFLQALQDYYFMAPDGNQCLEWKVPRLFPTDDPHEHQKKWAGKKERPIVEMSDIIQEILTKHANGIHFVEWNAGTSIDSVMKENGFRVDIVTDWTNGFILGGNGDNCGTWMDKMGSSPKANNRGVPATPRDGAAIEIIGLLASTLRWLSDLSEKAKYTHQGVKLASSGRLMKWKEWRLLIVSSFESWFYVPLNSEHDDRFFIEHSLVGIRGIYKDTVGSSAEFGDYQFRPNLCITMTVASELFDPVHARKCLDIVEDRLMGRLGMKTLDPSDWRYLPYYDNSEDSENFFTSAGFNYHNGPEWLWLTGYFFRASMNMKRGITPRMTQMLANLKSALHNSFSVGLPELTNKDGAFCKDSCPTQAWSIATLLDVLYDYSKYSHEEIRAWGQADDSDENTEEEK